MTKGNTVSQSAGYNEQLRSSINFFYGEVALRLFSFLWLYWAYRKYTLLLERPAILFSPTNFITKALIPALPDHALVLLVVGLAIACNSYLLFSRKKAWLQAVLVLCFYWLNMPQWSFGFLSHVNHIFLLSHLFLVFVKVERPSLNQPNSLQHRTINWFYAGILATYSMAGIWKVVALAYKLVTSSPDVHWLHPDAALFNAIVSYRLYDIPFDYQNLYTPIPYFWQFSFLAAVYIQTFAVAAAFRAPLRFSMAIALLLLHVANAVFFQTFFVVASLVLIILFMPYTWLFRKPYQDRQHAFSSNFTGKGNHARYTRTYRNGDTDAFEGFDAYREKLKDKNYELSGLLYFPGFRTVGTALLRLMK